MTTTLNHPVIGISGRKRSGKDTFAERLVLRHGFTRVALADPIRTMLLKLDPIVGVEECRADEVRLSKLIAREGWEGVKNTPYNDEVRGLLQRLGTDAGREIIGEAVWIDAALRHIRQLDRPVVITDVRFTNEAHAVQEWGGHLIRIDRPGLPETDLHPSETELDGFDFSNRVVNDGLIDDLWIFADSFGRYARRRFNLRRAA